MQLEQQVYSIEAANINHETLQAMKQAGAAMEQIHGGMSIEQVDETMYVLLNSWELEDTLFIHVLIDLTFLADNAFTGTYSGNNINWPTISGPRLLPCRLATRWTRMIL